MKRYRIDMKYWNGSYSTIVREFDSEHSFDVWLDSQSMYNKVIGWNEIDADGNVIPSDEDWSIPEGTYIKF